MKLIAVVLLFSSLAQASVLGIQEAWEGISDPNIMSANLVRNYADLPMKGQASDPQKLWAGDYWALNRGNINVRWNSSSQLGFKLRSPSRDEVLRMSTDDLAKLSPTEKYDIYVGRYDYPLVSEVSKMANRRAQEWEGICHGWAPATMNHREPQPKVLTNPDGVQIPFGSSDIKGLISYYYAWGFQVPNTHQMGRRCYRNGGIFGSDKDCKQDLNAGAFHIVLTNRVGLQGASFVADMEITKEVWNHPVHRFESRIVKDNIKPTGSGAPGTVKQMILKTDVYFVDGSLNYWHPILGTDKQKYVKKEYEYKLDINAMGEIIGGKWYSKSRPDFIWLKAAPVQFEGNLSQLGNLLND